MSIKTGPQTDGVINNTEGDQDIEGGQPGTLTGLGDAGLAAENLGLAFASTESRDDAAARELVDAIVAETRRRGDRRRTAAPSLIGGASSSS
jgi:hypothetical protein